MEAYSFDTIPGLALLASQLPSSELGICFKLIIKQRG
jgi:hypothetical protein